MPAAMSRTEPRFSTQVLLHSLSALPACKRFLVGFSGGADSTALLLALHQVSDQIEPDLQALHFNHGLQTKAIDWQQHCLQFCRQRNIPLQVRQLSLLRHDDSSFETAARDARYRVIAQLLEDGDIYLTAHQADDQAETLFLNLMRGSGGQGLAGIPPLRVFSRGWLARPLLNVRREALEAYLKAEQVDWITDTSNQDQTLDRNYLRGTIFPQLNRRWPGLVQRLNQTSRHLRDQGAALRLLLAQTPEYLSPDGVTLPLVGFSKALPVLQAEIIRNWVHEQGASPPPRARLQEFLLQLQALRADSHAELRWGYWLIKHHVGHLWMHELPLPQPCPSMEWETGPRLELGGDHGALIINGAAIPPFRHTRSSNRATLSTDPGISKTDKKIIKENMRLSGIPVWLRDTVPLLVQDDKLCAIGDWWVSRDFRLQLRNTKSDYQWQPRHLLLMKIQALCHRSNLASQATLV